MIKELVIIGGGAAGFFCAVNAAIMNPQLKITIIEKTGKLLSKVKVSGGGRCNVTHACFDIIEMSKKYPRGANFVKKTFHQFFTTDTIEWFKQRGVLLKEEQDGRMFPVTDLSQTIVDCLLREVSNYGIEMMMNTEVKKIIVQQEKFCIQFPGGKEKITDFICIASGGYPKSTMFTWLTDLGHSIENPVPSLFTFNLPGHTITKLMGVSVENVSIKISGTKLEQNGPILITHWGLSGPAVLKLSAWGARELALKNYDFTIAVNWLPAYNEQQLAKKFQSLRNEIAAQNVYSKNPFGLPKRLWEFILSNAGVNKERRWADLPSSEANKLVSVLCTGEFSIEGKTTFKEEFVTAGGIKLNEIDHQTMMSKKIPYLFFAGEVMDVDGITGGYNFQHAWTSGFIAGTTIGKSG